jgi:hypothetical protein
MRRKKANFSKTTTLTITILDGFLSRVNGPDQTHRVLRKSYLLAGSDTKIFIGNSRARSNNPRGGSAS